MFENYVGISHHLKAKLDLSILDASFGHRFLQVLFNALVNVTYLRDH